MRKSKKPRLLKAPPQPSAEEPLSDKWYNNVEICEVLKMSIATVKRRRENGSLKASKRFGMICFNHTHVQQYLRGGLSKVVTGFALFAHLFDGVGEVVMAM